MRSKEAILTLLVVLGVASLAHAAKAIVWVPADNNVVKFFNQAVDALNNNDPARAEARARKAIERQDNYGHAHKVLGMALARQGKLDEAINVLGTLDQRAPGRAAVLSEIAMVWFAKQDFERAGAYALDAVGRNPDHVMGWQALTLVRRRTGETDDLAEELAQEMGRSQRPEIACLQVSNFADLGRLDDAEEAMLTCEGAEDSSFLQNARATLAHAEGTLQPDDLSTGHSPTELLNKGVVAYREGDSAKAERLATRGLDAGAPRVPGLLLRAQVRYDRANYEGARKDIDGVLGEGGSWVTLSSNGSLSGILTKQHEIDLEERLRGAAGVLVLLNAREGDSAAATLALQDAREALGDSPELRAAEATALHLLGDSGKGWSVLVAALDGGDDPKLLSVSASLLGTQAVLVASDEHVGVVLSKAAPTPIYNLAVGALNGNAPERCALALAALRAPEGANVATSPAFAAELVPLLPAVRRLQYSCAVRGSDFAGAMALAKELGWGEFDESDKWNHIVALYKAENHRDLLVVARASGLLETPRVDQLRDVMVFAHLEIAELDEALAIANLPGVKDQTRLEVGIELAREGRPEAEALLTSTCGKVKGEDKERCQQALRYLRQ